MHDFLGGEGRSYELRPCAFIFLVLCPGIIDLLTILHPQLPSLVMTHPPLLSSPILMFFSGTGAGRYYIFFQPLGIAHGFLGSCSQEVRYIFGMSNTDNYTA